MAELDTYPAVQDEEEEKKRNPYPGAVGPMPTLTPAPVPAAVPPPEMPQTQYPAPSIGGPGPGGATQPAPPPPPAWKDYAPPERHGWAKLGSALAGYSAPINEAVNVAPERRAQQRYGAASKEYESELGAGERERTEASQAELRHAQAQQDLQRPATAVDVAKIAAGSREKVAETGAGSREKVAETGAASRESVAGIGAQSREEIARGQAQAAENVAKIRATQQPLTIIATPEGPRYVPRSQAYGQTPARALGPQEHLKISQNQGQLGLALPRAQYLHDHADMITNLIDSGKIAFSIGADGTLQASIGKGMTLTPEESTFAANFQNMTEDINLLRAPLGATGFRSEQAFEALQAQRGRLAQNPDVFKKVLEGTIASMQSLQQTNKEALEQAQPAAATTPGGDGASKEIHYKIVNGQLVPQGGAAK